MARGRLQLDSRSHDAKTMDVNGIWECENTFSEWKTSTGNP